MVATRTKTLVSQSYIWPADSQNTILCEGHISDQIVDDFGVNIKIRVVAKSGYNTYGDATKSYIDTYSKAYIHQWSITDDEVKEGIYKNGQIMFVFKAADKAKILPGNQIFFESEWYQITRVEFQRLAGVTYLINAIVQKTQQ
jgi:hypothetical protein